MPEFDPQIEADRIVHTIDPTALTADEKLHLADVLAHIAQDEEQRIHNLIEALRYLFADADEQDKTILREVIRRKLRVLPPRPGITDGETQNGGD